MSRHAATIDLPYIIATSTLSDAFFKTKTHQIDKTSVTSSVRLGDLCGLTLLGVNLVRQPPHTNSAEMHWHTSSDEWVYILDAGTSGATLITLPEGTTEEKTEKLQKGDFIAFPAGKRVAHTVRAGDEELVYLCGGTRGSVDVCNYPKAGMRLVSDSSGSQVGGRGNWYVKEEQVLDLRPTKE